MALYGSYENYKKSLSQNTNESTGYNKWKNEKTHTYVDPNEVARKKREERLRIEAEQSIQSNQEPISPKPVDQVDWEKKSIWEKTKDVASEVPSTIKKGADFVSEKYNDFQTINDLSFNERYREPDPEGKRQWVIPLLDKYKDPNTTEEERILIRQQVKGNQLTDNPVLRDLNRPIAKKAMVGLAEATSNIGLKYQAAKIAIEPFDKRSYNDAYKELLARRNDPNNNFVTRVAYGVQDSGLQSAVGVALNLIPGVGAPLSQAYYAALSASSQIQETGNVDSLTGIAVDTAGDTVLSGVAESSLKNIGKDSGASFLKSAGINATKGGITEGGTEVIQTLIKLSDEYMKASSEEERQSVIEKTKRYLATGMLEEFTVAGISGGAINTVAGVAGQVMNPKQELNVNPNINIDKGVTPPKDEGTVLPPTQTPQTDQPIQQADAVETQSSQSSQSVSKPTLQSVEIATSVADGDLSVFDNASTTDLKGAITIIDNSLSNKDFTEEMKSAVIEAKYKIEKELGIKNDNIVEAVTSTALDEGNNIDTLHSSDRETAIEHLNKIAQSDHSASVRAQELLDSIEKNNKYIDNTAKELKAIKDQLLAQKNETNDRELKKEIQKKIDTVDTNRHAVEESKNKTDVYSVPPIEKQEFSEENPTDKFQITLDDERKVNVAWTGASDKHSFPGHFEFRGMATSNTGYRSHFTNNLSKDATKADILSYAKEAAESFAKEEDKQSGKKAKKVKKTENKDTKKIEKEIEYTLESLKEKAKSFDNYSDFRDSIRNENDNGTIIKILEGNAYSNIKDFYEHSTETQDEEFDKVLLENLKKSLSNSPDSKYAKIWKKKIKRLEGLTKQEENGISKSINTQPYVSETRPKAIPNTRNIQPETNLGRSSEAPRETSRYDRATMLAQLGNGLGSDNAGKSLKKSERQLINEEVESLLESKDYSTNKNDYTEDDRLLMSAYSGAGGKEAVGGEGAGLLNEYYTPQIVIDKMWALAKDLNPYIDTAFEPSAGTGKIISSAPAGVQIDGAEISQVSGTIATILNPDSNITIGDFQELFFDKTTNKQKPVKQYSLVIGNPPFGERGGFLKGKGEESNIGRQEEYFIKRGLDITEDGGFLIYVVNSSFLKTGKSKGKESISKLGKLVRAYRLPENSFDDTSIGTDIVVFQKRSNIDIIAQVSNLRTITDDTYFNSSIGGSNVLGKIKVRKNRFGKEETYVSGKLEDAVANIITESDMSFADKKKMYGIDIEQETETAFDFDGEMAQQYNNFVNLFKKQSVRNPSVKEAIMSGDDGTLKRKLKEKGIMTPTEVDNMLYSQEQTGAEVLEMFKDKLQAENPELLVGKKVATGLGLKKQKEVRAVKPKKTVVMKESVNTILPKNNYQSLVTPIKNISNIENVSKAEVEMLKRIDRDNAIIEPTSSEKEILNYDNGRYIPDALYYSGDIYRKIDNLKKSKKETIAEVGEIRYNKQLSKLEKILPERVILKDISFDPIDRHVNSVMTKVEGFDDPTTILNAFTDSLNSYRGGKSSSAVFSPRVYASMVIRYVCGDVALKDTKPIMGFIKKDAKRLFNRFIKNELDTETQKVLEDNYNRTKNSYVRPNYSKLPMEVKDMANEFRGEEFHLSQTQKDGIGFLVAKGSGIIAYGVGVGKTHTLAIATKANMDKGWTKRPLFTVPKSTINETWLTTLHGMFPGLIINNLEGLQSPVVRRLEKERGLDRTKWIKDGEITVISHEGLLRLGFKKDELVEAAGDLEDALWSEPKTKREGEVAKTKNEEILGNAQKYVTNTMLSDLGFDHISVDEVHNFRKIFQGAKPEKEAAGNGGRKRYGNIIGGTPAKVAQQLFLITQHIQKRNNNRNVFLASATPFENHATEVYNILSLVARDRMKEMGILNINDFFSAYSNFEVEIDRRLDGEWVNREKMKSFGNIQSLKSLVTEFIDFQEDKTLIRPEKRVFTPQLQMSALQMENLQKIQDLLHGVKNGEKAEKADDGAFLKASTYSISNSISPYFIDEYTQTRPTAEQLVSDSPKIEYAIEMLKEIKSNPITNGLGTFLYFGKQGVSYHPMLAEYIAKVLKYKPEEVAYISGKITDEQKEEIKKKFNNGEIKVLIGGDQTKEGIDLQKNGFATINLALGWNPSEVTQVGGRVWRQGNARSFVIEIFPLVENSGDVMMYNKFEEKSGRINQISSAAGKVLDVGEVDASEKKIALLTDPQDKAKLQIELNRVEYDNEKVLIKNDKKELQKIDDGIQRATSDITGYNHSLKSPYNTEFNIKNYKAGLKSAEGKLERLQARLKAKNITDILAEIQKLDDQITAIDEKISKINDTLPDVIEKFSVEYREQMKNRKSIKEHVLEVSSTFGELTTFTDKQLQEMRNAKIAEIADIEAHQKLSIPAFARAYARDDIGRFTNKSSEDVIIETQKAVSKRLSKWIISPEAMKVAKRIQEITNPAILEYIEIAISEKLKQDSSSKNFDMLGALDPRTGILYLAEKYGESLKKMSEKELLYVAMHEIDHRAFMMLPVEKQTEIVNWTNRLTKEQRIEIYGDEKTLNKYIADTERGVINWDGTKQNAELAFADETFNRWNNQHKDEIVSDLQGWINDAKYFLVRMLKFINDHLVHSKMIDTKTSDYLTENLFRNVFRQRRSNFFKLPNGYIQSTYKHGRTKFGEITNRELNLEKRSGSTIGSDSYAPAFIERKKLYHATLENFDKFDIGKAGSNTGWENANFGVFFLEDKEEAKRFIEENRAPGDVRKIAIKEAYVTLNNPIDLTLQGIFTKAEQAPTIVRLLGGEPITDKQEALDYLNKNIDLGEVGELSDYLYGDINNKKIMQDAGYDGIVSDFGNNVKEYVAFDTDQIEVYASLPAFYKDMISDDGRVKIANIFKKTYMEIYGEKAPALNTLEEEKIIRGVSKRSFTLGKRYGKKITKENYKAINDEIRDYILKNVEVKNRGSLVRAVVSAKNSADVAVLVRRVDRIVNYQAEYNEMKSLAVSIVEEKNLKKEENLRKAMKLPPLNSMNMEQMKEWLGAMQEAEYGDSFLTQRMIETVKLTSLKGMKTVREVRAYLDTLLGKEFSKKGIKKINSLVDTMRWDTALAESDPFMNLLVKTKDIAFLNASAVDISTIEVVDKLAKASRKSVTRAIGDRLVPEDEQVFDYLESENKEELARSMTNEQLAFAEYIKGRYLEMRDYLIMNGQLEEFIKEYAPHIRQDFFETLKNKGVMSAFSGIFEQQRRDDEIAGILSGETDQIVSFEKFFQFALKRTGKMTPSKNVEKSFLSYVHLFEQKKALDSVIPKIMAYVYALTPEKETKRGLIINRDLKKFVTTWLNSKKGRRFDYGGLIRQGGAFDTMLYGAKGFTSIVDLGINVAAQIVAPIGEQIPNFVNLGFAKYIKGVIRNGVPLVRSSKGQRILAKYKNFTGRSFFEEMLSGNKGVGDKMVTSFFFIYHMSTLSANKQFLLGSLTKEEWENESISPERLAEMKIKMGRWRVVEGSKSIVGNTSVGALQTQYKAWFMPILSTSLKNVKYLLKNWDSPVEGIKSQQGQETVRQFLALSIVFLIASSIKLDDKDKSWLARLKARIIREAYSVFPFGMLLSTVIPFQRFAGLIKDLSALITQIVTIEEYTTNGSGYNKGDLKSINTAKRIFIPRAIKQFDKPKPKSSTKSKWDSLDTHTSKWDTQSVNKSKWD